MVAHSCHSLFNSKIRKKRRKYFFKLKKEKKKTFFKILFSHNHFILTFKNYICKLKSSLTFQFLEKKFNLALSFNFSCKNWKHYQKNILQLLFLNPKLWLKFKIEFYISNPKHNLKSKFKIKKLVWHLKTQTQFQIQDCILILSCKNKI